MLPVSLSSIPVHLATGSTDMRKGINGLASEIYEYFEADIFSNSLFAFCSHSRKLVKIIYWDSNGFCLWSKKLQKGRFRWPEDEEDVLSITSKELAWLLSGLEVKQQVKFQSLQYKTLT